MVKVEIVYLTQDEQIQLYCEFTEGTTIAEALSQSGLYQKYPETLHLPVGIFSKILPLSTVVHSDDRIEIYGPLLIDPKEKRRQRAKNSARSP